MSAPGIKRVVLVIVYDVELFYCCKLFEHFSGNLALKSLGKKTNLVMSC